ncbi:hemolysin family protein [Roseibacillus persicicus]|uniref:hemolysin family protein n=1 Tax=Roseibacillus persicicus TaxID=454148 RepID=UPI00280E08C9|nr:hemolysin family protein [Roseibacillus persicicus]MDQ8191249.1 hemolysin family protein [Roseibacillus persicicus]
MFPYEVAAIAAPNLDADATGSWTVLIIYFSLAIGVSFFCSVWEAVILSISTPYVANLKKKQPKVGARIENLKQRIGRPLTSILTLNTISHTVGAMGVAAQVSALGGGKWDAVAGALMTLAILIASEIIPKNLGAHYWRAWAPWVSFCLEWLTRLMTPVVWFIELFSKGHHDEATFSRDELKVMAELGTRQGKLKEGESRILDNLLRLGEISVREVMTPRIVVFALPENTMIQHYLDHHNESPFSRIPVYNKNRDDVTGFVLKHDILLAAARDQFDLPLSDLKREIPALPEDTKLTDAFEFLVADRNHLATVLDEYGGLSGLVTMEDVVETLLGLEIVDEVDTRDDMQEFARKLWKTRAQKMGLELDEPKTEELATETGPDSEQAG